MEIRDWLRLWRNYPLGLIQLRDTEGKVTEPILRMKLAKVTSTRTAPFSVAADFTTDP